MKKLATLAMAASVFMMPFAANASVEGTYEGIVTVHKGLTFNCVLTAVFVPNPTHPDYLAYLTLSPGNPLCAIISLNNQPYEAVADNGVYVIKDINVTTITPGGCDGDAVGTYTATEVDVSVVLTEDTPGTGDCSIDGILDKQ